MRRIEQRGGDCSIQATVILLTLLSAASWAETSSLPPPALSVDAIVQHLMATNARRSEGLRGYRGKRVYHLDYHGILGAHNCTMEVEVTYTAPDRKEFKVLSQAGSKLLFNRVLLKLLSSEQEAQKEQNRTELEISPKNYEFTLAGTERSPAGDFYILEVKPKSKSRYLYRGKLWVDAHDFAVARMQGEPAKNPSLWISHTQVEYRWTKIDGFWFPARNESTTQVRFGGKAVLTIDYSDYQITKASRMPSRGRRESSTLPDPSAVSVDPH